MAVEEIIKKILDDAHLQVKAITAEAQAKGEGVLRKAEAKAESIRKDILVHAEKEARLEKNALLTAQRLDSRKKTLTEKQKFLDEAMQKAHSALIQLPTKDYQRLIEGLLLKNVETGEEEAIFREEDKAKITSSFRQKINKKLKARGKHSLLKLTFSPTNAKRGFILKGERTRVDCTLGALLKDLRLDLEWPVAEILFSEKS